MREDLKKKKVSHNIKNNRQILHKIKTERNFGGEPRPRQSY